MNVLLKDIRDGEVFYFHLLVLFWAAATEEPSENGDAVRNQRVFGSIKMKL